MDDSQGLTFQDFLDKSRQTRDRVILGYEDIREDFRQRTILDRLKEQATRNSLQGFQDTQSAYTVNEQRMMAARDATSSSFLKTSNILMGAAHFGTGFLPGTMISDKLKYGSAIAGTAGLGRLGGTLGTLSKWTDPVGLAASLGLSVVEKGLQESLISPYINRKMFSDSIYTHSRDYVAGIGSQSGVGGLSMNQSMKIGANTERFRDSFRDLNPEDLRDLMNSGLSFTKMGNPKKVGETIAEYMTMMVGFAKQFKGKERELAQAMEQFAGMGMTVSQAGKTLGGISKASTMLNIDPTQVMATGAGMASAMQGTGISQYTGFQLGAQAHLRTAQMLQLGQISKTQFYNLGGTSGMANTIASGQMAFLNSKMGDMFLKSMYQGQNGINPAGINQDAFKEMLSGNLSLREAQYGSQATTLSPRNNMMYQFDKDALISNMGDKLPEFVNRGIQESFSRNPFGNNIQGRAKYLMKMTPGLSKQEAMLMVQQAMSYNPTFTKYLEEQSETNRFAGQDPFYSSESSLMRGLGYAGRGLGETWKNLSRDSLFAYANTDTRSGKGFWRGVGQVATLGQLDNISELLDSTSYTRDTKQAVDGFKNITAKDLKAFTKMNSRNAKFNPTSDRLSQMSLYNKSTLEGGDWDFMKEVFDDIGDTDFGGNDGPQNINNEEELLRVVEAKSKAYLKRNAKVGYNVTTNDGQKVEAMKYVEGRYVEQYASKELREKLKKSRLAYKGGLTTDRSKVLKRTNPSFLNPAGSPYSPGGSYDTKMFVEMNTRFNSLNSAQRLEYFEAVQNIANGTGTEMTNEQSAIIGVSRSMDKEDAASWLQTEGVQDMYKSLKNLDPTQEKRDNLEDSISSVMSSKSFKNLYRKYGNENIGLHLSKAVLFNEQNAEGLKMSKEAFMEFKKDKDNGFSEISKYLNWVDDGSGQGHVTVSDKLHTTNKGAQAKANYLQQFGEANSMQMKSVGEAWDKQKWNQATSIQDFAVAVATGMRMANGDSNSQFSNAWNPTDSDKK